MKFSEIEKQHLLKAWLALSFAFAILYSSVFSPGFMIYFVMALLTVGLGFMLHEIAHKYVAQRYGCWAEFRADDRMLMFTVISAFLGFVFAAPGAVYIQGHVTIEKNGKISLAGPVTNILLSIIFLSLMLYLPSLGLLTIAFNYGYRINAFIALFNMLPFMNFDGVKIIKWNKIIYVITIVFAALLVLLPIQQILLKIT